MKIAILNERHPDETRVAATPDAVKKYLALGAEVCVESGAGVDAHISDHEYQKVGATVEADLEAVLSEASAVLCVRRPVPEVAAKLSPGCALIGMLGPHGDTDAFDAYASQGLDSFAMELMPRISRAQSMDVLSSQSNLAGYKAVVDAAARFSRAMPMMMTAAGTVAPAKVFVLGAGVAGLQAIATARRLGAVVSATDVRPAVKEQVESLGATFVMVDSDESEGAETAGGYAREMSEDYRRRQAELVSTHLAKQDIVITTALIPGRPAPVLVTEEMVASMRPGSIIVDLAVEQGGNCPLSRPGEVVVYQGVTIVGQVNVPGQLPVDASALYSRNLFNFLSPFIEPETKQLSLDWNDEVVSGTCLTHNGQVVHPVLTGEAAGG